MTGQLLNYHLECINAEHWFFHGHVILNFRLISQL